MLTYVRAETVRRPGSFGALGCCRICWEFRARQALGLLLVPLKTREDTEEPVLAIEFFDELEIYPGTYIRPDFLNPDSD